MFKNAVNYKDYCIYPNARQLKSKMTPNKIHLSRENIFIQIQDDDPPPREYFCKEKYFTINAYTQCLNVSVHSEALGEGKSWGEVKQLARNRIRWRRFVDALCPKRDNRI